MSEPATRFEPPDVEDEIEQVLAICDGDPIAALRATLIANAFLERRVELLRGRSVIRLRSRYVAEAGGA